MSGMNRHTGRSLGGDDHVDQSINDILTTPINSRVMRRPYGSLLADLVDAPFNEITKQRMYVAAFDAIHKWEPRRRLLGATILGTMDGKVSIAVEHANLDGTDVRTTIATLKGAA